VPSVVSVASARIVLRANMSISCLAVELFGCVSLHVCWCRSPFDAFIKAPVTGRQTVFS
jgi:hypothetical protein